MALLGLALFLCWDQGLTVAALAHPRGLNRWLDLSVLMTPSVSLVLRLAYCATLLAFVAGRAPVWSGTACLVLLALKNYLDLSQWPMDTGIREPRYIVAACLAACIAGRLLARGGEQRKEAFAHEALCGILAATYTLAGLSKLLDGGAAWPFSIELGKFILWNNDRAPAWLGALRMSVAARPGICVFLAASTLALELCGAALLWPSTRRVYVALAALMHLGIFALMGVSDLILLAPLAAAALPRRESPSEQ